MSFFKSKITKKLKHVQKACKSFIEIFQSKLHKKKVRKSIKNIKTFLVSSRHKISIRPLRPRSTTSNHYYLLQKGFPAIYIDELYVPKSGQQSKQLTSKDKESYVTSTSTSSTNGTNVVNSVATKHDSLLHENKKGATRNVAKFDKEPYVTSTSTTSSTCKVDKHASKKHDSLLHENKKGATRNMAKFDKEPYVHLTSTSTSTCKVNKNVSTKHDSLLHEKATSRTRNMANFERPEFRGVDERAEDFISKVRKDMKLQREQSILDFQEMLARSV